MRERERVREKKRKKTGGGVLQGLGNPPPPFWDLWWNRAAPGAGLLTKRSNRIEKPRPYEEVDQTPMSKNAHTPRSHYTGTIYPRVKEQIGMLKMAPL
jgi:hypothetical protein